MRLHVLKKIIPAQFLFVFVPWSVFWQTHHTHLQDKSLLEIGLGKTCTNLQLRLQATLARSSESREQGLGGKRKPLSKTQAMLFVFDPPVQPSFWMKDTYIPLSLAYFGVNSELLKSYEMQPAKNPANPKEVFEAPNITVAAVEAAPHAFEKLSVKENILCAEQKK